jgi:hyperosmotically inducible periplasmic protein
VAFPFDQSQSTQRKRRKVNLRDLCVHALGRLKLQFIPTNQTNKKMKKLTLLFISSVLALGTAACQQPAKTSADAPNNPATDVNQVQTPSAESTQAAKNDAESEVRRRQLNSDIRAREQRNNIANDGASTNRAAEDLASQVRSKLEANIPNGALAVKGEENGTVTVTGTVTNKDQLNKIEPLAKEIKGVTKVVVNAKVAQ